MKSFQDEHEQIVIHLQNIKQIANEMREEGIGGMDFENLYVANYLIPAIKETLLKE